MNYYDRCGCPIDAEQWVELAGNIRYCQVAIDQRDGIEVSTVWLGIDRNHSRMGPPIFFETMVFGGEHDQEQVRYSTEADAVAGHQRMVSRVWSEDPPRWLTQRMMAVNDWTQVLAGGKQPAQQPAGNPETGVIDAIDQLVNEQLAVGPVDDYNADRYDKCDGCGHDWHGVHCFAVNCRCLTSESEVLALPTLPSGHPPVREVPMDPPVYTDQIESVTIGPASPQWLDEAIAHTERYVRGMLGEAIGIPVIDDHEAGTPYTLVDLQRWRERIEQGRRPAPRVRFWSIGDDGQMTEVHGELVLESPNGALQLDAANWFGGEIPGLPAELQFTPMQRAQWAIDAQRERRELDAAVEIGTPEEYRYPRCPQCGDAMPGMDPADVPEGCLPPICLSCLASRED